MRIDVFFFKKLTVQEGIKICIQCLRFKTTEIYSFALLEPRNPKSRCQGVIRAKLPLKGLGENTSLSLAAPRVPRHYLVCKIILSFWLINDNS